MFQDITVGSLIGATEALILVPIVNAMDSVLMSNWNGVLAILLVFLTASCFYPTTDGECQRSHLLMFHDFYACFVRKLILDRVH